MEIETLAKNPPKIRDYEEGELFGSRVVHLGSQGIGLIAEEYSTES